jgi:hypothetical protein
MKQTHVQTLLQLFHEFPLCQKHPELTPYYQLALSGMLSDGMAKAILVQLQDTVNHSIDFPNFLHRIPTEEQLYAGGKPNVEVGCLVEDPKIRVGFILDRPSHVLCSGSTGGGKSTLIRRIILEVEALNAEITELHIPNYH